MKVIQRTPNLGLRIRLQPLQPVAEPEDVPAAAAAGALQVVWSAAENGYLWAGPWRGEFDDAWIEADLHAWRPGDAPITPISMYLIGDFAVAVATLYGASADAEIAWSLESTSSEVEMRGTAGVFCAVVMRVEEWGTPYRLTLTATVDGVTVGSVELHWVAMES